MAGEAALANTVLNIGKNARDRQTSKELLQYQQMMAQMKMGYGQKMLAEAEANKPGAITYTTPKAIDEYSKLLESSYRGGLPGEEVIRDQMGAGYAGAMGDISRTADSSVGALGAATGLYDKYINSVRDLGVQSAQAKIANEQNYIDKNANAALTRADYADKTWEYNVNIPYQRGMNTYESTKNAAYQNIFGGMDASSAAAVDYANYGSSQTNNMQNMIPYMSFGSGGGNTSSNSGRYGSDFYSSKNPN